MISKYIVNSFICGRRLLDRTYMYFHFFSEERGREDSRWDCKPMGRLGTKATN